MNNTEQQADVVIIYGKAMFLKIYVDDTPEQGVDIDYANLKNLYANAIRAHNDKLISNPEYIDAGFDLFTPTNFFQSDIANGMYKLDLRVKCSAKMIISGRMYNTGYYMYPRSSLSKTPLRLANSVGIIDAGYRGNLTCMFDVKANSSDSQDDIQIGQAYNRYVQICAPGLVPIIVEMVDAPEKLDMNTARGSGGFGSTGV